MMRLVIQNLKTRKFFRAPGQWVGIQGAAFDFDDVTQAILTARELKLEWVELLTIDGKGTVISRRGIEDS